MKESRFDYNRIRKYYFSSCLPLKKSTFVEIWGEGYFDLLQKSLSALMPEPMVVLLGYYASHINFEISEAKSFFSDREQAVGVVSCNMLLFEFFFDLLLFDQYRDMPCFYAIFGKYLRQIVGIPAKEFIDHIQNTGKEYPLLSQEERMRIHRKVIVATEFVVLHEVSHVRRDLVSATLDLFKDSDEFLMYVEELDDQMLEEYVCDFNALLWMVSPQFTIQNNVKETLECSPTNILTYGILMQYANLLLQLLKRCFTFGADVYHVSIDEIFKDILSQLNTRINALSVAAKLSVNTSEFSIENLDIHKALDNASGLLMNFFSCINEVFKDMLGVYHRFYEPNASNMGIELNDPIDSEEIWFLVK